ncbi:MAG: UbiA family prenyltransferase [Candidatus Limnocylindrales bacterium]
MLLGGLIRLVHPFPILLDGVASGAMALLAGGDGWTALRLGAAMVAMQASIGALNDLVDAPIDTGRKLGKPIPAGLVAPTLARGVVIGSAGFGLALAAPSGLGLLVVAGLGLAIGYGYDLVAKGTAWSWLPFALGIPLLPVFGWYGAAGSLPAPFAIVIPAAIMAGAALAIANAVADADRDRSAGVGSVAVQLGSWRAWATGALLQSAVAIVALASLWTSAALALPIAAAVLSTGVVVAGVGLGRASSPRTQEFAWEVQAVGVALLGLSWLWGVARSG